MKKKILFIIALFFVFFGRINAFTGDGSQANPYVIKEGESVSVDGCTLTHVDKDAAYKDNITLIQYDKANYNCLISGLKASSTTYNVQLNNTGVASNVKYVKVVENTDTGRTPQKFAKLLGRYEGQFNDFSYITYEKVASIGNYDALKQTSTQQANKTFIVSVAFYDTKFYINYGYGADKYTFNFPVLFELTYNQTSKYVSYDSRGETSTKKEVETYLTRMFFYWKYEVLSEEEIITFIKSQPTSFMEEYVKRTSSVGTWGNSTNEIVRANFETGRTCPTSSSEYTTLKLAFNSNGGTNQDERTILVGNKEDEEGLKLDSPTKDGYIFDGWYADEALTKKIGTRLTTSNYANLTLTDANPKTLVNECLESDGVKRAILYAKWVEDGSSHGAVDPESGEDNPNTGATITFVIFMAIMLAFIILLSKNNKKIYKI